MGVDIRSKRCSVGGRSAADELVAVESLPGLETLHRRLQVRAVLPSSAI